MKVLDGDGQRLQFGGHAAARDIVQFVPFADYVTKGAVALAEDTLKEVSMGLIFFSVLWTSC
jgi:hypothetical protein